MRNLFLTITCILVCASAFAQKREAIYVSVVSKQIDESLCHTIEDIFHDQLQDYYDIRLVRDSGIFSEEKRRELAYQESGAVIMNEIKEFGNERGVGLLCVISVETQPYNDQTEYYFRVKIFDVESGILKKTAMHPNINDTPVCEINTRTLQMVSSHLIARLGINSDEMQEQAKTAEQRQKDEQKSAVRETNGKALAYSLIPGVGLMMKGHKVEGTVYMVGDIALIGGGFALMANANKQRDIMNSYSTGIDQYKSAEKKYKSSKTAAYCCFGTAAGLYIVNLVRGYVAEPKRGARLQVVPSVTSTMYGEPNMSVNLALSYKF